MDPILLNSLLSNNFETYINRSEILSNGARYNKKKKNVYVDVHSLRVKNPKTSERRRKDTITNHKRIVRVHNKHAIIDTVNKNRDTLKTFVMTKRSTIIFFFFSNKTERVLYEFESYARVNTAR